MNKIFQFNCPKEYRGVVFCSKSECKKPAIMCSSQNNCQCLLEHQGCYVRTDINQMTRGLYVKRSDESLRQLCGKLVIEYCDQSIKILQRFKNQMGLYIVDNKIQFLQDCQNQLMHHYENQQNTKITGQLVSKVLNSFGKDKSFLIKDIHEKITAAFEDYGKQLSKMNDLLIQSISKQLYHQKAEHIKKSILLQETQCNTEQFETIVEQSSKTFALTQTMELNSEYMSCFNKQKQQQPNNTIEKQIRSCNLSFEDVEKKKLFNNLDYQICQSLDYQSYNKGFLNLITPSQNQEKEVFTSINLNSSIDGIEIASAGQLKISNKLKYSSIIEEKEEQQDQIQKHKSCTSEQVQEVNKQTISQKSLEQLCLKNIINSEYQIKQEGNQIIQNQIENKSNNTIEQTIQQKIEEKHEQKVKQTVNIQQEDKKIKKKKNKKNKRKRRYSIQTQNLNNIVQPKRQKSQGKNQKLQIIEEEGDKYTIDNKTNPEKISINKQDSSTPLYQK